MSQDIRILKKIGTISSNETGLQKELNAVAVDGEIKFDLRTWAIGHTEDHGGISFNTEEAEVLFSLLREVLKDPDSLPVIPAGEGGQIVLPVLETKVDDTPLLNLLKANKIEYIDKREKGGALWIVAGHEIDDVMMQCAEIGFKFSFTEKGGKQTKGQPGWYIRNK